MPIGTIQSLIGRHAPNRQVARQQRSMVTYLTESITIRESREEDFPRVVEMMSQSCLIVRNLARAGMLAKVYRSSSVEGEFRHGPCGANGCTHFRTVAHLNDYLSNHPAHTDGSVSSPR